MASLSILCCPHAPSSLFSPPNINLSTNVKNLVRRRRAANSSSSCSSSLHYEAELWSSVQPQLTGGCLPWIVIALIAACNPESRRMFGPLSAEVTHSVICNVSRLLRVLSGWRGAQGGGGLAQILAVLILAKVFYPDIAPPRANKDALENVPQDISGVDVPKGIQKPKTKKAEVCTQKCVGTCIRGGAGSPGEGPLNVRRPLVVFKEGFRTRKYCLIECSDICNLIGDGDDGP